MCPFCLHEDEIYRLWDDWLAIGSNNDSLHKVVKFYTKMIWSSLYLGGFEDVHASTSLFSSHHFVIAGQVHVP